MWRVISEARVVQECSSEGHTGILIGDKIYQLPCFPPSKVGQVMVVKAVDAEGRPTRWEAVDISGGPTPDIPPDEDDITTDDIATDKEVSDTLDDIFGSNAVNE